MARKCIGLPFVGMIALCAILLLAPDSRGQQVTAVKKKYSISGTAGLAGVTLNGFPTPTLTDQNGAYSAEVEHGWSGTVTPVLNGYKFEPRMLQYPKVVSPMGDQNYTPTLITYTISGTVLLPEVKMVGFPEEVVSDASGRYTATVPWNWTGKVTPEKTAFQFDPSTKPYNQVTSNLSDQNYKGSDRMIMISGTVGVQGAVLKGLPGNPVSGPGGVYRVEVKYGTSVNVTPTLARHAFTPPEMVYPTLTEDQLNQNYKVTIFTYQISGTVGMAGVVMNGLPGSPLSDGNGFYTATVEDGWSGKVTPEKPGYTFTPPMVTLTNVTAPKENQNFTGKVIYYTISGTVSTAGVTMSGLTGNPISNDRGQYTAQVEYGWSGIVTPTKEGYNFTPPSKDYSVVSQNQTQNYTAQAITFKVSGTIGDLPQVILKGFPAGLGTVITGQDGSYSVDVPYNWKGVVTPQKPGFMFDPNSISYDGVLFPQVSQNYTPKIMQCILSGQVVDETGKGVEGVFVQGNNNASSTTSDATGKFELQVNYAWTGELTFQKDGFTFNPSTKAFTPVAADLRNLAIAAKAIMVTIADRIMAGAEPIAEVKVTATPDGGVTTMTDTTGVYRIQVPYGWSGELKFEKEGFEFNPDTKPFMNVTEDMDALNPKPAPPVAQPPVQTPVQTPPVQTPVQTPAPQPAPPVAQQQIQQQIGQLTVEKSNLTGLVNAYTQRGQQVPAQMVQRLNEVEQQLSSLMAQLGSSSSVSTGPAPTLDGTVTSDALKTLPQGSTLPPAGPAKGPVVRSMDGRPKLHDVLKELAKKTDVKIEWDATVKNDSVSVGLSGVEGMHVAQALQTIVTSIQPPYTFKTLEDGTYVVFRPISNAFPGTRLDSALQDVATTAGVPIVVDPNVMGDVFVSFENVSLDEALELMLAGKPYVFKKTPRYYLVAGRNMTGDAFPAISETRRVRLNYVQPARAKALLSPIFAQYVQAELPNSRDPNDEGNMLLITAAPVIADRIIEDLKMIDRVKRQVLLDARVVVMEKGNLLNLGAEWSWPTLQAGVFTSQGITRTDGTNTSGWPYGVQIGYAPDQTFTNSLMMALNLLQQNSQADIIANPKVVAQDGRQAEMRVIEEEWFMMQATQTAYTYSQAQLQKIESGTALIITPYIGDNNDITLQMAVEVSDSIPKARGSDLPRVTRRLAKNSVTVKDGGTVAVGGLTENRSKMEEKRVPGLSSIPLLGALFKNKNNDKASREVAVFVTAHLVPEGTQTTDLPFVSEPSPLGTVEQPAGDEFRDSLNGALTRQNR